MKISRAVLDRDYFLLLFPAGFKTFYPDRILMRFKASQRDRQKFRLSNGDIVLIKALVKMFCFLLT